MAKNEFRFTTAKKTIWTESEETLKEAKPTIKAFGTSATLEGTSEEELGSTIKWGANAVEKVWEVEKMKLFNLTPPEKALATTGSLSGFTLKTIPGATPNIGITCTSVAPSGTIKNRREMIASLTFEGCTGSAGCGIREGLVNGRITFKSLEGRIEDEKIQFKEGRAPIASFEIINAACAEAGTYKVTSAGAGRRAFTFEVLEPENPAEEKDGPLENKFQYAARGVLHTMYLTNESTSQTAMLEIGGDLGLKLSSSMKWNLAEVV
jgi:hypothetical protein